MIKFYLPALTIPMVDGTFCTYLSSYGNYKTFGCEADERCCKDKCCGTLPEFYTLWYFWVAVFLLLVLFGGLSYVAWRRWVKQQTIFVYTSPAQQLLTDYNRPKRDVEFQGMSPPPYVDSPPSYSSQDSLCQPPPYQEKYVTDT